MSHSRIAHMPIANGRLTSLFLIVHEDTKQAFFIQNRPEGFKVTASLREWTYIGTTHAELLKKLEDYTLYLIDIDDDVERVKHSLSKFTLEELKYLKSVKWQKDAKVAW